MMINESFSPQSHNLSIAWAKAFLEATQPGRQVELSPLVVTVTDIEKGRPNEITNIRDALDARLAAFKKTNCHTVANTLFPQSMWNSKAKEDNKRLFERYEKTWPRIRKCNANNRGSYFHRMTAYCPKGQAETINQLSHIIDTYKSGNHRRSALQAAIFDPTRDHLNNHILRFPCLQQVAFVPVGEDGLCVTGFYPMHYLFERAYGNYLGLCRLGNFMATYMNLTFCKMVCVSSVARLDYSVRKRDMQPLRNELTRIIADLDGGSDE